MLSCVRAARAMRYLLLLAGLEHTSHHVWDAGSPSTVASLTHTHTHTHTYTHAHARARPNLMHYRTKSV